MSKEYEDVSRSYCLSYLTLEVSPPETVAIAAEAGFDTVGVRLLPAVPGGRAFALMDDTRMLRETERMIADTGVEVFDVEIARIDGETDVEAWLPMLEVAGRLGAKTVIAAGLDPDSSRLSDTFGALCDAAVPFGLSVNLEFTPWAPMNSARAALDAVLAAGRPNGEVLIDTIHVARSATTLDDLRAISPELMTYFQICDCPASAPASLEEMLYTAREERLLPGEGGADLAGIISALPQSLAVSVEIPSHRRIADIGALDWARTCLARSKATMEKIDEGLMAPVGS